VSRRTERIADLLREEIAQVLRREASDPRLALVTLTRVDVAPDLSHALVFWSALELPRGEPLESVQEGLDAAAPFLRGCLARSLSLKRTPRLDFRYDPSLAEGSQMLALLREIADESET
jgi:ribosome-binding factor A